MTLIVAPASPANALVSLADALAYHAVRGNAAWAALASDTLREQAIIRATDFMEAAYGLRYAGVRATTTQALSWPRYYVPIKGAAISYYYGCVAYWPGDSVPAIIANACAELALRTASGVDLAPDTSRLKSRTKVGPIEVDYVLGSSPLPKFTAVERMLAPFFGGSGGSMNIPVFRS